MSVRVKHREHGTHISIPTDANRDAGIFLLFLGAVGVVPLYYLFVTLGLGRSRWNWEIGAAAAIVVALLGIGLILFSRKHFLVREGSVTLKDGLFAPKMRYQWKGDPAVRLSSIEEEVGGKAQEVWLVNLVDGKYQYTLDRRPGQQIASRALAEMVAKAIGCPVIEKVDHQTELRIERHELDLPFVERVQKYPQLMGQEVERPGHSDVEVEEKDDLRRYVWRITGTAMLFEVLGLFGVLLLVTLAPLPVGAEEESYSLLAIARQQGDYLYFYVLGAALLAVIAMLFGYRSEIVANPQLISTRAMLWGVPFKSSSIPVSSLENISARLSSRGAYLQFISDERIITERLPDLDTAAWLAWQIRRFYSG